MPADQFLGSRSKKGAIAGADKNEPSFIVHLDQKIRKAVHKKTIIGLTLSKLLFRSLLSGFVGKSDEHKVVLSLRDRNE
jgi:hypothetical protein